MPQVIYCDSDDGQPAAFLITNMENGDVLSPCLQHAGSVFWTLAQALGAIPDQEPPAGPTAGPDGPGEAEAATATARPKRRRAGRQAASQALDSEASPFPDAAPVDS